MTTQTLDQELGEVDRAIRALEADCPWPSTPTYRRMLGKLYGRRAELVCRRKAAEEVRRDQA